MSSADKVFEDAILGGMEITPAALAAAIRSALIECRDPRGQLSLAKLYELTCELDRKKPTI